MHRLRHGDSGPAVAEVRSTLASIGFLHPQHDSTDGDSAREYWQDTDAVFDAPLDSAVRAFQQQRGLLVDGVVGPATYRALKEASYRLGARTLIYQLSAPLYGDDVAQLQHRLQDLGFYVYRVDGFFGQRTHEGLSAFQREIGLSDDGICGPDTLRSLELLGARVTGGNPHRIAEEEVVHRAGPQLTGKRIVIDPGFGGADQGFAVPTEFGDVYESEILWGLASRLEGRMAATGMETFLSRRRDANPTDAERAETSNSFDANLMISLRCAISDNPAAQGVAGFYYGNSHGSVSMIGQVLAGFIQREVVARTALQDCRTHQRTWDILRLTKMPTVQIDLGYLTNAADAELLTNPRQLDVVAEAILVAVKRLYLLGQDDQPTGTYTFAELLAEEMAAADSAGSA
ncbi:N-acetylmuramoyl-L-alanine amidase [Nocardia camponoti]|uniref:N-acetylmuramoyl-L-alanine amidase n=1 Tax=Nocardia camponoti TaxID=1616106 RepID=A0A917QK78_9NOCA|nr:N-acetylmuramoyl-L-alanine amidase [Nocardia camponoti]GGK54572.1 N-acetylmuramoyl-L-alanine amidase [Nocardia camponoti]